MKKFLVLFFLFSICFVSCAGDDDDDGVSVGGGSGPCKGVICSGHGTCYEIGDNLVSCNCEEGYVAEGIDCVLDDGNGNGTDTGSDPCAGVTCSGHGNCYEKDGKPACNCEQGYDAQGTNCVEEGSSDPCAGKDCNNHGTCNSSTGQCECEENWLGEDCSKYDTGAPWVANFTGAVNEEIKFNRILCGERTASDDEFSNELYITFYAGDPYPAFEAKINSNNKGNGIYNKENSKIRIWLGYKSGEYYGDIRANAQITIKNYEEKVTFEGEIISPDVFDGVNISPQIFNFKCPCVKDDEKPGACKAQ